jgi:hypothetical protein
VDIPPARTARRVMVEGEKTYPVSADRVSGRYSKGSFMGVAGRCLSCGQIISRRGSRSLSQTLRFLPPNMAALFGPAIGTRISRQDELGYITHRGPTQQNKNIYSLNITDITVSPLRW